MTEVRRPLSMSTLSALNKFKRAMGDVWHPYEWSEVTPADLNELIGLLTEWRDSLVNDLTEQEKRDGR